MLPVVLSGLVLICNFWGDTLLPSSFLPASLLFTRYILISYISHLFKYCDKQYQSSSQKLGHMCHSETVEPQEIPFKVCVIFYNALSD